MTMAYYIYYICYLKINGNQCSLANIHPGEGRGAIWDNGIHTIQDGSKILL